MNIYALSALLIVLVLALLLMPLLRAGHIPVASRKMFGVVVAVMFLGGGLGLYHYFGTPQIVPLMEQRSAKLAELKTVITTSSEAIKHNPQDIKSWLGLGDSFMESGQYDGAANAYRQGVLLTEGNPMIIMAYARALIFAAGGEVTADAKKSLDMVQMLTPENEEMRYYQAIYKLQNGNNSEAMAEMKALYNGLRPDSPLKAMIDEQIGRKR